MSTVEALPGLGRVQERDEEPEDRRETADVGKRQPALVGGASGVPVSEADLASAWILES